MLSSVPPPIKTGAAIPHGLDGVRRIEKHDVAPGIFWVHVAEANLSVLCGCPPDSVKHLRKRGLIAPREKDGVPFESGPNAILLSDVLVQNGRFANLAEFPVLHMFYRQGLILPNHPNNSGVKPLLMGCQGQVDAQKLYIYRGNYGLVCQEELTDAGVPSDMAHQLMRLKLKFAFGQIRATDELLDTLIVDSVPAEIRSGVTIRRLGPNLFEFEYAGERVTVDLNLGPDEHYEVPYALDHQCARREDFGVIDIGDCDGWDEAGPCMSSVLTFQGKVYVIDAGPNVLDSLAAIGIGINEIDGIFHTHAHDDHFADLPVLMRADHRIRYFAAPAVRASVTKKLCALLSEQEAVLSEFFDVRDLEVDVWNDIDGLEVRPIYSPHPVETTIFQFRARCDGDYRSYAHLADIATLGILEGMITEEPAEAGMSREYYEQVKAAYLSHANLKKIDVGGGLVHGRAEDFAQDPSDKVILSHTTHQDAVAHASIGDRPDFGAVDVLIPAQRDYNIEKAIELLASYFPEVPARDLAILTENPVIAFRPGKPLSLGNEGTARIYLLLTGHVQELEDDRDPGASARTLTCGALLGEAFSLGGATRPGHYVGSSHGQALSIPRAVYLDFLRDHGLFGAAETLRDRRTVIRGTPLLDGVMSYPAQNRLAHAMVEHHYDPKDIVSLHGELCLVQRGKIAICLEDQVLESVTAGGFCGEDGVLIGGAGLFELRVLEPTTTHHVPWPVLREIPAVRWPLTEAVRRRNALLASGAEEPTKASASF